MTVNILVGDSREVLCQLPSASVHAVVTDPPYGLNFMGKAWDYDVPDVGIWRECFRILKPGGHLLSFFGTRTYHRGVVPIEDAGFEIRDQIGWLYGSGFPKSSNQHGDWEGWGTALKPAWEPIVVARKPITGTVPQNLRAYGVGALNIDGCRVEGVKGTPASPRRAAQNAAYGDLSQDPGTGSGWDKNIGRWPANVIHDGSDEVVNAFPEAPGQIADVSTSSSRKNQNVYGSASRFFYVAKASRADRNDGLESFEERPLLWSAGTKNPGSFQSEGTKKASKNTHPTVKPTELMRYLCRLVTPPGGVILDPFMGSGSTGRGAVLEGFSFVGIEMDAHYAAIAKARIAAVELTGGVFA